MAEFNIELIQNFLVALLLGALVGIEREKHKRAEHPGGLGGLRTFILFAQLGAISGWLSVQLKAPWLFIITVFAVSAVVLIAYVMENRRNGAASGLISELAAITVCLLGGAVMYGYTELAVSLGIVTSAILVFKQPLHGLVNKIGTDDLYAGMKLLIASFVVLPLLPNHPVDPWQALNPYKLWLLVILISTMSLLGYAAIRWLGTARGTLVTGISGGLASSTAATLSFARSSKLEPDPLAADTQAAGVLIAWLVMFIRVFVTVGIVYTPLLSPLLAPLGTMALATAVLAAVFYWQGCQRYQPPQQGELQVANPFSLIEAIKFGSLFAVVLLLVKLVEQYASAEGIYLLAIIAGLTDVDAISLSMADYARQGNTMALAVIAITLAVLSNTVVKCGLVLVLGSKALATKLLQATPVIMLAGVAALWLF